MASIVTHAALPLLAERALPALPERRRLAVAAVICSLLPDLDLLGRLFDVHPNEPLGHQGLTHSLLAAAVIGIAAAALAFRSLEIGSRAWWSAAAFLSAATAAHGLADAMTANEIGVAFFAPFSWTRYFLPWRPLPICPLGLPELLGRWGLLVITNEAIFLLVPAYLLSRAVRLWQVQPHLHARTIGKLAVETALWLATANYLLATSPSLFRRGRPRIVGDVRKSSWEGLDGTPRDGPPGGWLETRLDELQARQLLGHPLTADRVVWSSSFFPGWYGGEAGRWQESALRLVWRTLFGTLPPTEVEARRWLAAAKAGDAAARGRLFTLAPTEKIDLAYGDFSFGITRQALGWTHNGSPRYWYGACNGIATAALYEPEPFRVVEVVGRDGVRLRFHPNDVKALLAAAFYETRDMVELDSACPRVSLAAADCGVNPAALVLALTNRLGLAHRSFLVDTPPTPGGQYYAVAEAEVQPLSPPRPVGDEALEPSLAGQVASLLDVRIDLTLSSTTLPYAPADRPVPGDDSRYQLVGLHPVPVSYEARLALGASSEILGGRWTGVTGDGPKVLLFQSTEPLVDKDGKTLLAPFEPLSWPLIRRLAEASAAPDPASAVVDLQAEGLLPDPSPRQAE